MRFEGEITADPATAGTAVLGWNSMFSGIQDPWSGSFTGPDTLEGSFDGVVNQGSAGFGWNATFTATR